MKCQLRTAAISVSLLIEAARVHACAGPMMAPALAMAGCGRERPACSAAQLTALEASYVRDVVAACEGYALSDCPDAPSIESRYARLREDWVQCR